ncbi:hypothetical protein BU26DRAFT_511984 [Trematosphaeria pertusa]|uniref:Uncharacterized protein n=1 Tax=Trematosphaeria pertusa TaxID=390896 RepID=A0A6A6HTI6_9PLEO|nr:uncharacterized protein BU26DRAFT_511984 [Trematosphaeria pertusa]KAF2240843.1 hypothetical protein BU26DRAFT_511984 [Trematosphaeria pertusa]
MSSHVKALLSSVSSFLLPGDPTGHRTAGYRFSSLFQKPFNDPPSTASFQFPLLAVVPSLRIRPTPSPVGFHGLADSLSNNTHAVSRATQDVRTACAPLHKPPCDNAVALAAIGF